MEKLARIIHSVLPNGDRDVDVDVAKIKEIMILANVNFAKSLVTRAISNLQAYGILPENLDMSNLVGYAGRLALEEMNALGLLPRHSFSAPRLAKVKSALKENPRDPHASAKLNWALFLDATAFMREHFLPTGQLLAMLARGGDIEVLSLEEWSAPRPYSDMARTRVAALGKANFADYKTRPYISEPITMPELLREARLFEPEAARVLRKTSKSLGDQRRLGQLPKGLYVQEAQNGTVYYPTQRLLDYINGGRQQKER